jgi:hypothetical protein
MYEAVVWWADCNLPLNGDCHMPAMIPVKGWTGVGDSIYYLGYIF